MTYHLSQEKIRNFSTNKELVTNLYSLTLPSYFDNSAVLEREMIHCTEIYILKDGDNNLISFFMVNFEKVNDVDTFYLGLSACHINYKGKGLTKILYNTFLWDCIQREMELKKKIICWWTTATPIAYHWFNKNLDNVEPNLDGNISEDRKNIFLNIIESKYPDVKIETEFPFILRGVAKKTLYSSTERARLLKANEKLQVSVFERYQIDEPRGDRFLMIGYAPSHNILIDRVAKE